MITKKKMEQAKAIFEQGNQFRESGKIEDSIQSYRRAIEIKPTFSRPLVNLAEVYESRENWTEATKSYRRLIGLEPNNHKHYIKLAKVLVKQNKIYGAIAAYQEAIELKPDLFARAYKHLGDLLLQDKDD